MAPIHKICGLGLLALCASSAFAQAEWPKPKWERVDRLSCSLSQDVSTSIGNYEVKVVREPGTVNETRCQAYLVDHGGKRVRLLSDERVSVYQGTGQDLFNSGNPALVLEGYSGGAHCCYTYQIVDLGEHPVILSPIQNQSPFFFFKDPASHQYRIMTSDGEFDYFDNQCHACTPMPRVVLQVDASGLHNVSPQFEDQYDTEIAAARARIAQKDVTRFQIADFDDARQIVLEIVLSYLYSGREQEAWQTLDEMWPAKDRHRIESLIVQTRAKGLLSRLSSVKVSADSH